MSAGSVASGKSPAGGKRPSAARLRRVAWYQRPRYKRLTAMLVTAVVMAQVTGEQGVRGDLFAALEANFTGSGLWLWLSAALAIWAVREFLHGEIASFTASVKRQSARPVKGVGQLRPEGGFSVRGAPVWLPALVARSWRLVLDTFRRRAGVRWGGGLALLAVLIVLPLLVSTFWQQVMAEKIGIYVLIAIGLNVVVGWAGMLDLGFVAFFAIGAYSAAYWTGGLPAAPPVELHAFLVVPVAVLTCLIAGVLLGAPTLRLRGDYLAIVTLGFHEIVYLTAKNWGEFTGGIRGANAEKFSVDLGFWSYEWGLDPAPYYWLVLGFVVVILALFFRLEHSRVGRAWTAIREDEIAAAATGVDTVRFKLLAFAIGASTSGVAGVVYASKLGYINPELFVLLFSVLALSYVVFGGMGSIPGVLLGAALLVWLPEALRDTVPTEDRYMYLGGLLVVMMIYRPQGLWPSRRRRHELRMAEDGSGGADALGARPGGATA